MSVLAKEINSWFSSSQELLQAGFQQARKAGGFLAEAQELAGVENFNTWLNENCSMSIETAQKLIDLFNGKRVQVSIKGEKEVQNE